MVFCLLVFASYPQPFFPLSSISEALFNSAYAFFGHDRHTERPNNLGLARFPNYIYIIYLRVSEVSETLSGLFNRESRYLYNIQVKKKTFTINAKIVDVGLNED